MCVPDAADLGGCCVAVPMLRDLLISWKARWEGPSSDHAGRNAVFGAALTDPNPACMRPLPERPLPAALFQKPCH